jgi:DnaJ-class molecular chaperone
MSFPYLVLDVPETATDDDVRRAYLLKIREFPPERAPDEFQRVCDAYALIKTELDRARLRLFGMPRTNSGLHLAEVVPKERKSDKRFNVGVNAWIEAIASKP